MTTALVLRAQGIGHLLTAVPALRALRRSGIRIALACPPELSELAALTGVVDRLIPAYGLEPIMWPGLTDRNSDLPFFPEIAVNLHGRGPRSTELLADLRPRRLWAYAEEAYPPGPKWDDDEHETRRWCRLVEWYGLKADPRDLLLPPPMTPSPAPGAVVIHPGGTGLSRRWPPERFAQVARAMAGDDLPVVVTGSRKERPLALLVATQAVLPPQIVLAGRTSLRELCALVAGARLVISSDTGVSQLATAYGTPSVTIFGPERPERWGPPKERPRHQALRRDADPTSVTTADMLRAASAVLSEGLVRR
ncbi:glycosyltransferase family 9 protein [Herbidospora galbida]|uniref:Glycosyltransferase family 9 protein n=1 Tax=Herbidospora galbida TaxID=2575442 RepID=A0A4U3MHJ5_9ACTN|nr:glycosyltransferase family 9 protein [Herbidospora galbida]TKK88815.1 glycosyltransferase family 9 protein [Herbidospora galbida]